MVRKLLMLISLFVSIGMNAMAQTVSGRVSSAADGSDAPGVSVTVKGSTTATITDASGEYQISASPNSTLVFSAVGFITQEVPVNGRAVVNVSLAEDNTLLDEVVVTALGVARQQKSLGYATTTIKSADLIKVGNTNLASSLYGKAPGVRIATGPGGATSASNITIRGINSITGRNQPLIILDGVPIRSEEVSNNNYWDDQRQRGNGLNDINPEDIENLTILKGASAAALYGSEAVNGVVLITTKRAQQGKRGLNLDFNANYSVDKVAYLPRFQTVRGAGGPTILVNAGQDELGFIKYADGSRGLPETGVNFGALFDGHPIRSWDGQMRPYSAQPDGYKNLFQDAHNSNINVALSQANDFASFRFSLTRQDNEGVSLNAKNERNIANLNTSLNLSKAWKADITINYINQLTKNRPYSTDRMINNFTGMLGTFDNGLWYREKYQTSLGYRFVQGASGQSLTPNENIIYNGFRGDIADYMWRVYRHQSIEKSDRVLASLTNTFQILKDLNLRARVSTDFTGFNAEEKKATERPLAFGSSGEFVTQNNKYNILYGDLLLTYTKRFNDDFSMSIMGGYTATKSQNTFLSAGTNGGLSTENKFDLTSSVNDRLNVSLKRTNRLIDAVLGTVNFDYKGFAFIEGTIRRDRTSTMNPNNNSFVYPSVNASFVFSEALDMPSFVNYGKLRASWGIVGNYPDPYVANVAYDQRTLGSTQYTFIPVAMGNDGIRPERKHEFEIGLETRLADKVHLDVAYYNSQIVDQILPLTLPSSSGGTSVLTNIGTLRNKGIEVGINTNLITAKDYSLNLGINYAWNKNVVEKLTNDATELLHADYDGQAAQLKSVVGSAMGDLFVPPVAEAPDGQKIVRADGLYQLDATKWKKVGNTQPKGVGGISLDATYKNFFVNVMTDFRIGGYVMPTGINWMHSRGMTEESLKFMDKESGGLSYYIDASGKGVQTTANAGPNGEKVFHDGMLMEGVIQVVEDGVTKYLPNTNVISQALYYQRTYNWGGPQYGAARYELFIEEATYWKMRELSVGYNLPSKVASKLGASKINVSVYGRNLFFIYRKLKDLDPEVLTAGSRWSQTINNAGTNPATRGFGIMLRSTF